MGWDILSNSILNIDGLFVPHDQSQIIGTPPSYLLGDFWVGKFKKILLLHQVNSILENTLRLIENAVSVTIRHKNTTAK